MLETEFASVIDKHAIDYVGRTANDEALLYEELLRCCNRVVGANATTEATLYAFRDVASRTIKAMAWIEYSPQELCPFHAVVGQAHPPLSLNMVHAVENLGQAALTAAANMNSDSCPCGNTYRADSNFCRKCGQSRGGAQSAVIRDALTAFCIENLGEAQVAILTSEALTAASLDFISSLASAGLEEDDIDFAKILVRYSGEFVLENDESIFISALSSIAEHSDLSDIVNHLENVAMRVIGAKQTQLFRGVVPLLTPLNVVTTRSSLLELHNTAHDADAAADDEEVDSTLVELMSMGDSLVGGHDVTCDSSDAPFAVADVEDESSKHPSHEAETIIRRLFDRYDYDQSGTINGEQELHDLTSATFVKLMPILHPDRTSDMMTKGADHIDKMCQSTNVKENPMSQNEYVEWYYNTIETKIIQDERVLGTAFTEEAQETRTAGL